MKKLVVQIILLFASFISCAESYAGIDSTMPPCIKSKVDSNRLNVSEYDYKGQRWFVTAKANAKVENYPDKLTTLQFYNENCKLVCIWQKGGVAGLNKVTPDTIDKKKIILIRSIKFDTLKKKDTSINYLPGPVIKIADLRHGITIQEYMYMGQRLYLINVPLTIDQRKELINKGIVTVDDPYYDEKGKTIILYKRALEGSFMRAARWMPASVKQVDIIKVQNGYWYRKDGTFKK
jgi:hypothetical protein